MAVVLSLTGLLLFLRFRADETNAIDRSLQTRGREVATLVGQTGAALSAALGRVTGTGDDFAQVLDRGGKPVATTPQVGGTPLLGPAARRRALEAPVVVEHAPVPGLEGPLRLRAAAADSDRQPRIVVVGTALGERNDSLRTLAILLVAGGAVALALAALAGYAVATAALRPVESMRRRATAISRLQAGQRLPVPPSGDELARLGETLNEMLARLEAAFARERRFVAEASHELRTPLGILKAELELALRRDRSASELRAALESAAQETDRLVTLAEDLLVLARVDEGRLALRPDRLRASELLAPVSARFGARALEAKRSVRALGGEDLELCGDRARLEQALRNMVDNALRHGDGEVELRAVSRNEAVELHVLDGGPGFPPELLDRAFARFARADGARSDAGAGLGLAIVAAIAASHGGRAAAANRPGGGADVWIELPGG